MAGNTTFVEAQLLTRAAPTLATEGQALKDFTALTVVLEAESGQTLSGAGSLHAYFYDIDVGAWVRMPDLDLLVTASGVRRVAYSAFQVIGPRNSRIMFACNAVTASGGTTATVYQLGFNPDVKEVYP